MTKVIPRVVTFAVNLPVAKISSPAQISVAASAGTPKATHLKYKGISLPSVQLELDLPRAILRLGY
jgi:hypothetical protein